MLTVFVLLLTILLVLWAVLVLPSSSSSTDGKRWVTVSSYYGETDLTGRKGFIVVDERKNPDIQVPGILVEFPGWFKGHDDYYYDGVNSRWWFAASELIGA